jgi:hypothetical protein
MKNEVEGDEKGEKISYQIIFSFTIVPNYVYDVDVVMSS